MAGWCRYPHLKYLSLKPVRWFPVIYHYRVEIRLILLITLKTLLQLSCHSSYVEHLPVPIPLWKEHECIINSRDAKPVLRASLPHFPEGLKSMRQNGAFSVLSVELYGPWRLSRLMRWASAEQASDSQNKCSYIHCDHRLVRVELVCVSLHFNITYALSSKKNKDVTYVKSQYLNFFLLKYNRPLRLDKKATVCLCLV